MLGAHTDPGGKPACYVPDYLATHNFEVHAVNPLFVGRTLWARPCIASLNDIHEPIDMVDVFRRPEHLMAHMPGCSAYARCRAWCGCSSASCTPSSPASCAPPASA